VNRALALAGVLDARMTAELDTALWVWGCLADAPPVHTASIRRDTRGRLLSTTRVALRETTVPDEHLVGFGPVRVSSRARTAVDVALLDEVSSSRQAATAMLLGAPGVRDDALALAVGLGHTPGKRRALERLRSWSRAATRHEGPTDPDQPPLTR
jgi:hypothetical protein